MGVGWGISNHNQGSLEIRLRPWKFCTNLVSEPDSFCQLFWTWRALSKTHKSDKLVKIEIFMIMAVGSIWVKTSDEGLTIGKLLYNYGRQWS